MLWCVGDIKCVHGMEGICTRVWGFCKQISSGSTSSPAKIECGVYSLLTCPWCAVAGALQRLVPEPRTFNIVMNACNSAGQYGDCITVHERMLGQNVSPTVGTYNAVLLAYCK